MTDATFHAVNGHVSIEPATNRARQLLDSLAADFPLQELAGTFAMDANLAIEVARAMLADDLELSGLESTLER